MHWSHSIKREGGAGGGGGWAEGTLLCCCHVPADFPSRQWHIMQIETLKLQWNPGMLPILLPTEIIFRFPRNCRKTAWCMTLAGAGSVATPTCWRRNRKQDASWRTCAARVPTVGRRGLGIGFKINDDTSAIKEMLTLGSTLFGTHHVNGIIQLWGNHHITDCVVCSCSSSGPVTQYIKLKYSCSGEMWEKPWNSHLLYQDTRSNQCWRSVITICDEFLACI